MFIIMLLLFEKVPKEKRVIYLTGEDPDREDFRSRDTSYGSPVNGPNPPNARHDDSSVEEQIHGGRIG